MPDLRINGEDGCSKTLTEVPRPGVHAGWEGESRRKVERVSVL